MTASSVAAALPNVLVVDDTPDDRRLVGALIEKELGWKVTYAEEGSSALEMIAKAAPSLVLTDLQMPKVNGLRLVSSIRRKHPAVPVVLMTSHGSEEVVVEALQAWHPFPSGISMQTWPTSCSRAGGQQRRST